MRKNLLVVLVLLFSIVLYGCLGGHQKTNTTQTTTPIINTNKVFAVDPYSGNCAEFDVNKVPNGWKLVKNCPVEQPTITPEINTVIVTGAPAPSTPTNLTCWDGTPLNSCSTRRDHIGMFCEENYRLVYDCKKCGCQIGKSCDESVNICR